MVPLVVRTPAASAGASSSVQLSKACVPTAEESKTGGLLPRPSKSTLVDIDKDTVATLEDSSKTTIMPHIRIPWLLKDGGRVGGDAILKDIQGRVEALITNTQSPPIHFSQRLSPGIMRDASRSAFRPYRPSRPVAGRQAPKKPGKLPQPSYDGSSSLYHPALAVEAHLHALHAATQIHAP